MAKSIDGFVNFVNFNHRVGLSLAIVQTVVIIQIKMDGEMNSVRQVGIFGGMGK